MQIDRLGRLAGHGNIVIAAETHDVGKLAATGRVAKNAVARALEGDPAFDANARPGPGQRPDAEHEDIVRPTGIAVDVVVQEVLPHDPVVDPRAADPALEHGVGDDLGLDFVGAEIDPQ